MAIFLFPFAAFFLSGDWESYLARTVGILAPLYLLVFLVTYANQSSHGESWRALIERITNRIPLLGTARRNLALSRLAAALEALVAAGVRIVEAWEIAGVASGSPALRRAIARWKHGLEAGQTPAEVLRMTPYFPPLFADFYQTGEVSGDLDESLLRMQRYYQEEGSRKLHAFSQWTPRIFYLAIVFLIAWKVVSFWTGYYSNLGKVLGG